MIALKVSQTVVLICASFILAVNASPPTNQGGACGRVYDECLFKFEGETGLNKYDIPYPQVPDKPFTPIIAPKDPTKKLGVLQTNGIIPEFIWPGYPPLTIVYYSTFLKIQQYTSTHFKPFWMSDEFGSAIGHETFQGRQEESAKGRCVRIYFTSFQVLEHVYGQNVVVENRNDVPKSENMCVVFET